MIGLIRVLCGLAGACFALVYVVPAHTHLIFLAACAFLWWLALGCPPW